MSVIFIRGFSSNLSKKKQKKTSYRGTCRSCLRSKKASAVTFLPEQLAHRPVASFAKRARMLSNRRHFHYSSFAVWKFMGSLTASERPPLSINPSIKDARGNTKPVKKVSKKHPTARSNGNEWALVAESGKQNPSHKFAYVPRGVMQTNECWLGSSQQQQQNIIN